MEDDQQFCLRWNNHQSTIIQNFDTLLESGTLVDCTLAAEGKYLKAHKVVLSACSPYFEGLLSEHYDKHPVFILKDVKFKELKAMMDYMYRGEVNISQDQLTALLKAAESLQIKGLSDSRTDKGTGNTGNTTTGGSKDNTRPAKTASSTAAASASAAAVDIPHSSSGLTIEKNSKVPRQSIQQVSVSDQLENSASPQLRGHSSREGSQSPTRKRKRLRRRSLGNDDNSMENHEASNSSDVNMTAPALGVAPVAAEEKNQADPADSIGRSALMQQLTKPADEMLQMPLEKPEPSEDMIQPKSEYQDDQESVEDLTHFDDDMNDLNEMEQDNSRAGPSHDPSQHGGIQPWHIAGDRSNASVVGAAAGPGAGDEVFLAAAEAAQAQRDSQDWKPVNKRGGNHTIYVIEDDSDVESIKYEIVDENFILNNEQDITGISDDSCIKKRSAKTKSVIDKSKSDCVKSHGNYTESNRQFIASPAEDGILPDARVVHRKFAVAKANKRNCSKRSSSGKILNTVKKQARLYCSYCDKDVNIKVVGNTKKNQECDKCTRPSTFVCTLCKRKFATLNSTYQHLKVNCKSIAAKFRCTKCSYKTKQKGDLKRHIDGKHKIIKCPECDQKIRTYSDFLLHQFSECPHEFNTNSFVGVLRCDICDYFTRYKNNLKMHIQRNHKN